MSVYKLRPHHGLCLHFFRGRGYSAEFVANMEAIKGALEENPIIQLVTGGDSVCRTCPNRVGKGGCISDHKVLRYDQAVVELCGLSLDGQLSWAEFAQRVERHILDQNLRETVCGDCQWSDICIE